MPIIDLQCHWGVTQTTRSLPQPVLADAQAYAETYGVESLCFASAQAASDLDGGNAELAETLKSDTRFRGWLTLSVHQSERSQQLAAHYFRQNRWIGARFEQETDGDALDAAGGHEVLTALRRYGKPILVSIKSHHALHAAVAAAREFHGLRFVLSPQSEDLASDMLPTVKEVLNISMLPCAALVERDVIAQAIETLGERGERRVLWGSDWGKYHPAAAIGIIKDSAINPMQRERILYRNAKELMPPA